MAKKVIKEMQMQKFTYEIVINVGNYQSIRIGGEWSVTETPTTEQVVKIDAELRQKVAEVIESRKASAQPQPQPQPQPEPQPEPQPQPQPEPQPEPQPQPQPEDKRELVTTSKADERKLKAILKKIQDGVPEETVRKYFRFDEKAEFLVNTVLQDVMRS